MNESTLHSQGPGTVGDLKSLWDIFHYVAGAIILYPFAVAIYNLYFSPLAKFPGPKLAAATGWYEAFHDIWDNDFHEVIEKMHEKYGPIVRINPGEIHIKDASFFDKLFVTAASRRTNIKFFSRVGRALDESFPLTPDHDLHHRRRKLVEPFFSRLGISRVESVIHSETKRLDERICSFKGSGSVFHLEHAYEALAADIMATIACGDRPGLGDSPESSLGWHNIIDSTVRLMPKLRNMSWLSGVVEMAPLGFLEKLYPEFAGFKMMTMLNEDRVVKIKAEVANETKTAEDNVRQSIFHTIARSDIPESEKSAKRLVADGLAILLASSITTTHVLTFITYYILANPDMEKRLREELQAVMADYPAKPPSWSVLEKVPYLNACIKEGLRVNHATRRNARMSPDVELQYKEWTIPTSAVVAMSIRNLHLDPEVFPEPEKFQPERWLGEHDVRMHKYLAPFQKGSRDCVGKNLAYAELYTILGTMFRPGGPSLTLVDCDESDIYPVKEAEMGIPKKGSRGLNVLVN